MTWSDVDFVRKEWKEFEEAKVFWTSFPRLEGMQCYALSTETDDRWKEWTKEIWIKLFESKRPTQIRVLKSIFSKQIEDQWYKFRVNVMRRIHFGYNRNRVLSKDDKKLLAILRDYQYEMSVSESKLLKLVYGFEMV